MLVTSMTTPSLPDLLAQIADIPLMERGKLSAYTFKDRARPNVPYYKLQQLQPDDFVNESGTTASKKQKQKPWKKTALRKLA